VVATGAGAVADGGYAGVSCACSAVDGGRAGIGDDPLFVE